MYIEVQDIAINQKKSEPHKSHFFRNFLIFVLLLGICFVLYKSFFKKDESVKENFLEAISKININLFLNNDEYKDIYSKVISQNCNIQSTLNLSGTIFEEKIDDFDISDFDLNVETFKIDEQSKHSILLNYEDNEIFKANIIRTKDETGIFADVLVDKYLTFNNENVSQVLNKINLNSEEEWLETKKEYIDNLIKYYKKIDYNTIKSDFMEYLKNLPEESFTQNKGQVTLIKENLEQISVDSYSAEISNEFLKKYYGIFITEDIENFIKKYVNIENIYNNDLKVTIYKNNNAVQKLVLYFGDEDSIDIEFENVDTNERKIYFTYINSKSLSGVKVELYKNQNDIYITNNISVNIISNQEVTEKYSLDLNTKITQKVLLNLTLKKVSAEGEVAFNFSSNIKFGEKMNIEDFNDENSFKLDNVSNAEFIEYMDVVNANIISFYNDTKKNMKLINVNSNDLFNFLDSKGVFQFTYSISPASISKEEAISVIVGEISRKLTEAEENGNIYSLQDVQNLAIDGYEIDVSAEENIVYITINGLNFSLDNNFNLSFIN